MLGLIREKTRSLASLLAKPFIWIKMEPNIVSFLGIPFALFSAGTILSADYPLALLFALLASAMDFIDGSVAKALGKTSLFGNYFETMIDKFVELILLAPFALLYPLATVLALGFSLIESYAKPRAALVIISDNRDWPAIGEHGDRLIVFLAGLALLALGFPTVFMEYALWLIAAMTLVGGIQRIFYAKKLIAEAEKQGQILPYLKKGLNHRQFKE